MITLEEAKEHLRLDESNHAVDPIVKPLIESSYALVEACTGYKTFEDDINNSPAETALVDQAAKCALSFLFRQNDSTNEIRMKAVFDALAASIKAYEAEKLIKKTQ